MILTSIYSYEQFHSMAAWWNSYNYITRSPMPSFYQQTAPVKDMARFKINGINEQVSSLSLIASVNQFRLDKPPQGVLIISHTSRATAIFVL
jgi:hypothetical protein